MHFLPLCLLPGPSRERPERKEQQDLFSLLDPHSSGQREGISFLQVLGICSATVYHFCATVVLPTPKGFPSIFLTLFSCSSDKKERAYFGILSVYIYYKLLNFSLPLSSGWETLYLRKEKFTPSLEFSESVCLP